MRVKGNQPELLRSLELWFTGAPPLTRAETLEWEGETRGHGRWVRYRIRTTAVLNAYLREELGWPGIGQAFCIEREEVQEKAREQRVSVHYGITDLSLQEAPPWRLLGLWRRHWEVENKGHWVLDTVFQEDRSRARTRTLPLALTLLRQAVMTCSGARVGGASLGLAPTSVRALLWLVPFWESLT